MSLTFEEFANLYHKFINPTSKWSDINNIYPKLIHYLQESNSNYSDIFDVINKRYHILSSDQSFQQVVQYLLMVWVIICIVGSLSNGVVIFVLARVNGKTVYDIICIGLAMTDLIILIVVVPVTTMWYSTQHDWEFSDFLCPLVIFIIYVALFSSGLMLLTLTVTRFLAVVHPWQNRMISAKEAKIACCVAWMVGGIFSIPVAFYFGVEDITKSKSGLNSTEINVLRTENSIRKCKDLFPNQTSRTTYFVLVFLLTYILPFKSIIIMNYMIVNKLRHEVNKGRNDCKANTAVTNPMVAPCSRDSRKRQVRNRVTKMVILVTTLYCVCWLPTQLINVWYYCNPLKFPKNRSMQYMKFISQTLSFASACVNPIVYSVVNETFKKAIRKQFPCCFKFFTKKIERIPSQSVIDGYNAVNSHLQKPLTKSMSDNSLIQSQDKTKIAKRSKYYELNFLRPLDDHTQVNCPNKTNIIKEKDSLLPESKKKKSINASYKESTASCSVFSYEGFTDNMDSANDNYNMITKV